MFAFLPWPVVFFILKYLGFPIAGSIYTFFGWPVLFVLKLIGFGPLGPIAGSFAAFWQAFWYGAAVPSGSVFAWLQHIAMTWFF